MDFIELQRSNGIATLMLRRGKVNALNDPVVDQLRRVLKALEGDPEVKSIVLTGAGKFFSFGFDIPEFLSFTKEQFTEYLTNFTDLYTYVFLYLEVDPACPLTITNPKFYSYPSLGTRVGSLLQTGRAAAETRSLDASRPR